MRHTRELSAVMMFAALSVSACKRQDHRSDALSLTYFVSGAPVTATVATPHSGRIAGIVTDYADERPAREETVRQLNVMAVPDDAKPRGFFQTRADKGGRYVLEHLPAGRYRVRAAGYSIPKGLLEYVPADIEEIPDLFVQVSRAPERAAGGDSVAVPPDASLVIVVSGQTTPLDFVPAARTH